MKTTSGINMWNRAKNLTTHDIDTHWSSTKKTFGSDGDKNFVKPLVTPMLHKRPETVGLPCGVGIFCPWPLDVKIDLSHLHLYNQYEGYSHTRQKKIKQMDFKSNPGSYVNVYVQMRSMTGKQKHCKKKTWWQVKLTWKMGAHLLEGTLELTCEKKWTWII